MLSPEQRTSVTRTVSQSLMSASSVPDLLETLLSGVVEIVAARQAIAFLYNANSASYVATQTVGISFEAASSVRFAPDDQVSQWLCGPTLVLNLEGQAGRDYPANLGAEELTRLKALRITLLIAMPLRERTAGWIALSAPSPGSSYDQEDIGLLQVLTGQAALRIENFRLQAEIIQTDEAKVAFVSLVAHELKIPMTSIKGYAKLLSLGMVGELSAPQREFLKVITRNVDRMDHLVSGLLDLSRLDAGRVKLERQAIPVEQVIQTAMKAFQEQIESRQIRVSVEIPAGVPAVYADPTRIGQVMTNLLSNACNFTAEGGTITIRSQFPAQCPDWECVETAQYVQIEISDTGIGIADEDKHRLFSPFFRGDHALAQEAGGTGLGLALTKRLVELHQGHIWFTSQAGQGSTFTFIVPMAPQAL